MSNIRTKGIGVISNNYEAQLGRPLDGKMLVPDLNALTNSSSWIYEVQNEETGEPTGEIAKVAYKGMIVGCAETGEIYIYQGDGNNFEIENWKKIGSDASDIIKDGILSSVVADEANNKLTFYWNTTAGIETTEIALSSIADIYTGVKGDDITVSVSNDNQISATLAETIKTAIENGATAYGWGNHNEAGYVKTTDLGELAYEDNLSAAAVGAYTKEEVDDLISNIDTSGYVTNTDFNAKVDVAKVSEAIANALNEAKQYADDNDANTTYGLEYDSESKTIKLVEKGTVKEIDATAFIKDGMLSSVVADQTNNKLTFYWNTDAGIETTEIDLSSMAEIYTGSSGEDININVSNSNEISANLTDSVKDSITQGVNAYNWGDHSSAGYLITNSDPIFNEDVIVKMDQGNFKVGDSLKDYTLPELIANLYGASLTLSSLTAPVLSISSDKDTLTVMNNNDYSVELVLTTNSWEGEADSGQSTYKVSGAYKFTNLTIPAHSSNEGVIEWNSIRDGILKDLSYNIECAFKYKKVYLSEPAKISG